MGWLARGPRARRPPFFNFENEPTMQVTSTYSAATRAMQIERLFSAERDRVDGPSSASRRCLRIAVPLLALAGGAASYALASGVNTDNYDQGATYQPGLDNGLIGAAGLVGGALLPLLAACGRSAIRALCERRAEVRQLPVPRREMEGAQRDVVASPSRTHQGVEIPALQEFESRVMVAQAGQPDAEVTDSTSVTIHGLPSTPPERRPD